MLKKKSKIFMVSFLFITITASIFTPSSEAISLNQTTVQEDRPTVFNLSPFDAQLNSFQIIDDQTGSSTKGQVLATIDATRLGKYEGDSENKFPGIDAFISKPFLTDASGLFEVTDEDQIKGYLVDPTYEFDSTFENGKHKFLRTANLAVDVAIRTYENLPPITYTRYYESPLDGTFWINAYSNNVDFDTTASTLNAYSSGDFYYTFKGGTRDNVFAKYKDESLRYPKEVISYPTGVLLGTRNVGVAVWDLSWATPKGYAHIDISMLDYHNPNWRSQILEKFGNSQVKVVPSITFKAKENFIKYDYYKPVSNKLFHIYTEDTQMMVFSVDPVQGYNVADKVTNLAAAPELVIDVPSGSSSRDEYNSLSPSYNDDRAENRPYSDTAERTAIFEYVSQAINYNVAGGVEVPLRIEAPVNTFSFGLESLDFANFGDYPKEALVQYEVAMRPFTTYYAARYHVGASGYIYSNNIWVGKKEDYIDIDYEFDFPYRLQVTNVYHVMRLVFHVVILSENAVEYIPTTGNPINVDDITDYGIFDVGVLNPDQGILSASILTIFTPWWSDLQKWFDINRNAIISLIVLAIIAIVAVIFAIGFVVAIPRFFKRSPVERSYKM